MAAYIIANVNVTDPEKYQEYLAKSPGLVENYGGKYLARGGEIELLEGGLPPELVFVVEFADMEAARAFYYSSEFQEVLKIRKASAESQAFILDGA